MVDLDALEALLKAATKGPWRVQLTLPPNGSVHVLEIATDSYDVVSHFAGLRREADANLIAAAPTAIADMIAELRELRALKARVEGAPAGEVMELGDDNEGQPRVLIYSTEAELRKGGALLFKRVALVGLND